MLILSIIFKNFQQHYMSEEIYSNKCNAYTEATIQYTYKILKNIFMHNKIKNGIKEQIYFTKVIMLL